MSRVLFLVVQLFSYPGDYVKQAPTLERAAEILMKLEEDALGNQTAAPRGPRRGILRLGPPIDVGELLAASGKPRLAIPTLTAAMESRIQGLLDAIGPGRPIEEDFTAEHAETAERKTERKTLFEFFFSVFFSALSACSAVKLFHHLPLSAGPTGG